VKIHEEVVRAGFQSDVSVISALVGMYAKCGSIERARELFDKMRQRDVISCMAMITGYAQNGKRLLKSFEQCLREMITRTRP